MKYVIRLLALGAFLAFVAIQIAAGYTGIDHALGHFWALVAVLCALLLRFTLPITIGAFFGAMKVWGWHWPTAALFASPGLIFLLPGVIPAIFSLVTRGGTRLTRATPISQEH